MRAEDRLAQQISDYLHLQFPTVIYHFDTGSGGTTSIGMAMRNKRLNKLNGYPDLFICKSVGGWNGLFIELKVESPLKKNGDIKSNVHLKEQLEMHSKLSKEGF